MEKRKSYIALLSILLLSFFLKSCNNNKNDINDLKKRNSYWDWWVDSATGKGEWVPVTGDTSSDGTGKLTTFYYNGKKCEEIKLKDGKKIDTLLGYDLNGELEFYETFGPDSTIYFIKDGYRKSYYRDGKLMAESNIKNHHFYGLLINYYKNGNKKFVRNYVRDSGWSTTFFENGQIKDSMIAYKNSEIGCSFKSWYEDGQIKSIKNWNMKTGLKEGITLIYYANGQLKDSLTFKNGLREGLGKGWYENGQLELINVYRKDIIISYKNFNEKGEPE